MTELPITRPTLLLRLRDSADQDAWAEFLEIYEPLVYRIARRRGLQHADCVDLCQEVFTRVGAAIEDWDPTPQCGSFRGWLFRIARNLIVDLFVRKNSPVNASNSTVVRLCDAQSATDDDLDSLFEIEYQRHTFHWAAEQIRDEFRESTWRAFWLTAVDGVAPQDATEILGMTVGAIYVARSRIVARLRAKIQRLEGDSGSEETTP